MLGEEAPGAWDLLTFHTETKGALAKGVSPPCMAGEHGRVSVVKLGLMCSEKNQKICFSGKRASHVRVLNLCGVGTIIGL